MKVVNLDKSDLSTCVEQAQRGRVVVMRNHKPIALIVGVEGLNREQLELGSSDKFWRLIGQRRNQKTIARAGIELESGGTRTKQRRRVAATRVRKKPAARRKTDILTRLSDGEASKVLLEENLRLGEPIELVASR
jgi:hypothetical protein